MFGSKNKYIGNNFEESISIIKKAINTHVSNKNSMLDIGCSVGRTCFELSNEFE